ncbi:hypothetical protein HDU92_005113 [Lobulomyces angularis]|nr:hypothetical protein HDU92_005113 [Lobulomyces angularis]
MQSDSKDTSLTLEDNIPAPKLQKTRFIIHDEIPQDILPQSIHRNNSEFNWERDSDSASLKAAQKKNYFSRLPVFLKNFFYGFVGSSVLMVPGIISYFFYIENRDEVHFQYFTSNSWYSIEGKPILFWSSFLAGSWATFFGLKYAFTVSPLLFAKISRLVFGKLLNNEYVASKISHCIDYTRHLKIYLTLFIWSILNLFIYQYIFAVNSPPSYAIISKIFLSLLVIFGVVLLEKLFLQIFAVQFHKKAYFDRLEAFNFSQKVLENLNKSRKNLRVSKDVSFSSSTSTDLKSKFFTKFNDITTDFIDVAYVFAAAKDDTKKATSLRQFGEPHKLAKSLFESLAHDDSRYLTLSDFLPYFSTKTEAIEAFKVFDRDENGDIDKNEMKHCVSEIFKEEASLEKSIHQSSQAIQKLDTILKLFCFVVILFIILGIFNINTSSFLTVAISLWAGLLFALGGSIKNLFESMIFLFITHPYDVGDRVEINGEEYFVKEFWLNTTVFTAINGTEIYSPNFVLAALPKIRNIRRSGPTNEFVKVTVALNTPDEKIEKLNAFLLNYIETVEHREFLPQLTLVF